MAKPSSKKRTGLIGFAAEWWSQLWRRLVGGVLIWVPLIITLWVSWFFINKLILGVEDLIKSIVLTLNAVGDQYPFLGFLSLIQYHFGLGFLVAIALFLSTGFFARYLIGRKIIEFGERILHRIPFVSKVYGAVTQIRDTFMNREGSVFQRVCLVDLFRPGLLSIAFITSSEGGPIQDAAGKKLTAIFVPTTPNPTSGYLLYLPPEDIIEIDISVEEAMKCIVSGGAYIPKTEIKTLLNEAQDKADN